MEKIYSCCLEVFKSVKIIGEHTKYHDEAKGWKKLRQEKGGKLLGKKKYMNTHTRKFCCIFFSFTNKFQVI